MPASQASLKAARKLPGFRRRYRVRRLVAAGVVAVLAVTMGALISETFAMSLGQPVFSAGVWGAFGAAVAAFTAALCMPFLRRISGRSQEARLLAAASPTHPLLHELMMHAPGTYAHSVSVANLAETVADEIGANALLARVGAYYHDIGKLTAPCYFFENLENDENPHDGVSPAESVAIITAHVRQGERLSRENQLPAEVEAIIREHHGTSLVRYFYHKASTLEAGVFEAEYRYQGEIPQSREAALIMLSDACEAAVRALRTHDAVLVEQTVRAIVDERITDGQLLRSGMSESDIETTINILTGMLLSMHHARCEYPRVAVAAKASAPSEEAPCTSVS